jgi:Flp pilus assembly protein TadD
LREGKYNDTIKAFDKAIEIEPQHALAWYNKGTALMLLRRNSEADAAFAKAKELGYKGQLKSDYS